MSDCVLQVFVYACAYLCNNESSYRSYISDGCFMKCFHFCMSFLKRSVKGNELVKIPTFYYSFSQLI